jgi:hypothetical protein
MTAGVIPLGVSLLHSFYILCLFQMCPLYSRVNCFMTLHTNETANKFHAQGGPMVSFDDIQTNKAKENRIYETITSDCSPVIVSCKFLKK